MKKNTFPKNTFALALNLKLFWVLSLALIIFLSIIYIFQINTLTKELYLNQNYEKKIEALTQENEALKIDFSKAGSLANAENYLQNQNFEKANQVKYIRIYKPVVQKTSPSSQ